VEIYNTLKTHEGGVNVKLGSLCASIATIIALSGESISMPKNGLYMIHNPHVFTGGESKDLIRTAGLMDNMKDNLLDVYIAKTGKPKAELSKLMDDETWFTAAEAKEAGFIDSIRDEDEEDANNRFDLTQFRNCAFARRPVPVVAPPKKEVETIPAAIFDTSSLFAEYRAGGRIFVK
jgi:ClpP protease-like protein